jgi:DivIVA domain-containing protein
MSTPSAGDPLAPRRRRSGPVRLSPDTVRSLEFPRTPMGRRGYSEAEVERFRVRVADTITRYDAEKAELRAEIERLRGYFRERVVKPRAPANGARTDHSTGAVPQLPSGTTPGTAPGTAPGTTPGTAPGTAPGTTPVPSVQAVNVLSQAQQAADTHVAQAQEYARRLVAEARGRCERILGQAYQQAEQVQQRAELSAQDAARARHAAQEQLRSAMDALAGEMQRLAMPAPHPATGPPGMRHDLVARSAR